MAKRVKITLDVFDGDSQKPEFTAPIYWNNCDYLDVTFLEDCTVSMLQRTIEAGYALAVENGASPEAVELLKKIARS